MLRLPFKGFFCLSLFSAGNSMAQSTPSQLNVKIQATTDSLYTVASLWGTTFIDAFNNTQHYDELTPIRSDMQEFLEHEIESYKKVPDVNGSVKLQNALVSLLEFEHNLVVNGFEPFEKLQPTATDKEVNDCRDKLKELSAKEKEYLSALNAERRAYTERNGIPLVPPLPPPPPVKPRVKKPDAAASSTSTQQKPPSKPQPVISAPVMKKVPGNKGDEKDKEDKEDKDEE